MPPLLPDWEFEDCRKCWYCRKYCFILPALRKSFTTVQIHVHVSPKRDFSLKMLYDLAHVIACPDDDL